MDMYVYVRNVVHKYARACLMNDFLKSRVSVQAVSQMRYPCFLYRFRVDFSGHVLHIERRHQFISLKPTERKKEGLNYPRRYEPEIAFRMIDSLAALATDAPCTGV